MPGLAHLLMFRDQPQTRIFHTWSELEKEFHEEIKKQTVGGPSIVFTRLVLKNVTRILNGYKVKSIYGLDQNALVSVPIGRQLSDWVSWFQYLWATVAEMPTGSPELFWFPTEIPEAPVKCEPVDKLPRSFEPETGWIKYELRENGNPIDEKLNKEMAEDPDLTITDPKEWTNEEKVILKKNKEDFKKESVSYWDRFQLLS